MKLFIIFVLLAKLITLLVYFYNRHEKAKGQAAREAEAARARAEMQRQRMVYQANIRRQQAIEREQARQAQEQARQAKEQAKIAKEQERQAAQLERHEDQIMKLNFRLEKAEDEIYHFTSVLETLVSQRESMQAELDSITAKTTAQDEKRKMDAKFMELSYASAEKYAEVAGNALNGQNQAKETEKMLKRKATLEGKLITLDNRIFTTEQRIKKAEYEKYETQRKLA